MLAEIRAPTEPGDDSQVPEDDQGRYGNTKLLYGRVVYMHAGSIDRPLEIVRMSWEGSFVLVPHTSSQGAYDLVTFTGTEHARCGPELGAEPACYPVELPQSSAWHEVMAPSYTGTYRGPRSWSGNLLTGKRDQSGLLYMRNRYYDPATGRFTQEDPIGIAGGLNVYGFAAGDPVGYEDPFGLKVCATSPRLQRAIDRAARAQVDWGTDGCATSADFDNVPGYSAIQWELSEMLQDPRTFTVTWGTPATRNPLGCGAHGDGCSWFDDKTLTAYIFEHEADQVVNGRRVRGSYRYPVCGVQGWFRSHSYDLPGLVLHELLGHGRAVRENWALRGHTRRVLEMENTYLTLNGRVPRCPARY